MPRIIDRYLLRQFVQVFVICWVSLTGLYIVFDAFSNLDEFMRAAEKTGGLLPLMAGFYAFKCIYFFDRTSAVLAMISAMFTVTWIQRHNELTALMAAGISRRRVVAPVIAAALGISLFAALNRELIIPRWRHEIARDPKNLLGEAALPFKPKYDHVTDVLMQGQQTFANEQRIHRPDFRLPRSVDPEERHIVALDCRYQPPSGARPGGYWFTGVSQPLELLKQPTLLLDGQPVLITPVSEPQWLAADECFVASRMNFEHLTGGQEWRQFSSTPELVAGLHDRSMGYGQDFGGEVRVAVHARVVQPFLDVALLFLGLPLVLRRENRNMFVAIGHCMALVAVFMVVVLCCQYMGAKVLLSPAFAAWLPLMIFAPAAVAMFDRVER